MNGAACLRKCGCNQRKRGTRSMQRSHGLRSEMTTGGRVYFVEEDVAIGRTPKRHRCASDKFRCLILRQVADFGRECEDSLCAPIQQASQVGVRIIQHYPDGSARGKKRGAAVACAGEVIREDEDTAGGAMGSGLWLRFECVWLHRFGVCFLV